MFVDVFLYFSGFCCKSTTFSVLFKLDYTKKHAKHNKHHNTYLNRSLLNYDNVALYRLKDMILYFALNNI